MIEILQPGFRTGAVHIPASKSQAHRLLICACSLIYFFIASSVILPIVET